MYMIHVIFIFYEAFLRYCLGSYGQQVVTKRTFGDAIFARFSVFVPRSSEARIERTSSSRCWNVVGVILCFFLALSSFHLLKTVFAALAFFNSFQISSALAAGIRMGRSKKRKQLPRNVWVTELNHLETIIECTHHMVPVGRFHCRIAQRHQGFLSPFGEASSKRQSCTMLEFQWLKPSPSYTLPFDVLLMPICSQPTVVQSILYVFTVYPKEMQRIW